MQAETPVLEDIITIPELEIVTNKLAEESEIKWETAILVWSHFLNSASSFLIIVLLPLPLIFGNIFGDWGILLGIMIYILVISLCMLGGSIW